MDLVISTTTLHGSFARESLKAVHISHANTKHMNTHTADTRIHTYTHAQPLKLTVLWLTQKSLEMDHDLLQHFDLTTPVTDGAKYNAMPFCSFVFAKK